MLVITWSKGHISDIPIAYLLYRNTILNILQCRTLKHIGHDYTTKYSYNMCLSNWYGSWQYCSFYARGKIRQWQYCPRGKGSSSKLSKTPNIRWIICVSLCLLSPSNPCSNNTLVHTLCPMGHCYASSYYTSSSWSSSSSGLCYASPV